MNHSLPLVANQQELDEFLRSHQRVIAMVFAPWCPFCMRFLPVFQSHAKDHSVTYLLVQNDQESMADYYGIDIIPTILFFEDGHVTHRLDGLPGVGLAEDLFMGFVQACSM